MKMTLASIVVAASLLLAPSCSERVPSFGLNQEFDIPFGQRVNVIDGSNSFGIQFTDLIEESRCPTGYQCVWAGRALVELMMDSTNAFTLSTEQQSDSAVYQDYIVELRAVSPYPEAGHTVDEEKYEVTLVVRRR